MRVQNTQNTNFGAIQIKGFKPNYRESILINKTAKDTSQTLAHGENFMCDQRVYILTQKGSELEKTMLQAIKEIIGEKSDFKVKSVPDTEAQKNIARFENEKPSIRQLFKWL